MPFIFAQTSLFYKRLFPMPIFVIFFKSLIHWGAALSAFFFSSGEGLFKESLDTNGVSDVIIIPRRQIQYRRVYHGING